MARTLVDWLKSRSDVPEGFGKFLAMPVPRNVRWLHTLGSLMILYILIQMVTGTLLAFYYSPTPDHAYDSVRYVREELFLGSFVHGLHKHGAAFCFCVALLHGLRCFLAGEYKKPRELLWMSGVAIFVALFAAHFTGALLPFDQNAYWGTLVRLDIVGSQPVVGDLIVAVLTDGTGDLGIVALTRFFILHAWVVPMVLLFLIVFHLKILRKTGWSPAAEAESGGSGGGDPPDGGGTFLPAQLFRELLVCVLGVLALFAVAAFVSHEDTGRAPGDETFEPFPDWYHAPLYQLLRVVPGLIGGVVIPGAVFTWLFLLPVLDGGDDRRISRRKGTVALGLLILAATLGFGVWGLRTIDQRQIEAPPEEDDPVARGRLVYEEYDCQSCHVLAGEGEVVGPNLTYVGRRNTSEWLYEMMKNPEQEFPETEMPPFEGTEQELLDLVQYMMSLK